MKFQQIKESLGEDADVMEQDHEVQMARADCFHAAKNAIALHHMLRGMSERQGLEGWVSEKITLAADYLKTVHDYLEYENRKEESVQFQPTDYNSVVGQLLGEDQTPSRDVDFSKRINTPNLSARARELLIKAFGQFPQAKNEIDAIINYLESIKNSGETNITRLDRENRQQDTSIDQLEKENTTEIEQISKLEQELQRIKSRVQSKNVPMSAGAPLGEMSTGATGASSIALAPAVGPIKKSIKRR